MHVRASLARLTSLITVCLIFTLPGCSTRATQEAADGATPDSLIELPAGTGSASVRVVTATRTLLADTLELSGEIQADPMRIVTLSTRASGTIQDVRIANGSPVRAGQVLATLYCPEFLAAQSDYLLAQERADRSAAASDSSELRRIADSARQRLVVLGAASVDVERLQQSRTPLATLPLRAPAGGIVSDASLSVGRQVDAGTDLLRVTDCSRVMAAVEVYERDISRVSVGRPALVSTTAYPGRSFSGRVETVGGALSEGARTLPVRIAVANPDLTLKPGMFATARLVGVARHRAIVLADAAVQDLDGQRVVFVATSDSQFVIRPVQVRSLGGGLVEITAGLSPGERVAAGGAFLLKSQVMKHELGEND